MSINLLIVDDERIIRESLKKYINWNNLGITQVITAGSGSEALLIMEKQNIGILLTDVRMPKMNGIELATVVRKKYSQCHIIFLSG